jgi:hypothetical protein
MGSGVRLESPRRHLDAALVPMEHALRERSKAIEAEAEQAEDASLRGFLGRMAWEFTQLAEEMHYW